MTADLTGQVVVVAGAGGAAGPPAVLELLKAGASVVGIDHAESALQPLTSRVAAAGGADRFHPLVLDLLDADATTAAFEKLVAEHGHLDGLFHLVGGWRGGKGIVESDLADWTLLHDLLIRTLQHTTRAAHDALVATGGRFAIVSALGAQKPTATNAAYATAKAAAEAWTLAVADSFAKAGGEDGPAAAAVVLQIKALLTDAMKEERPDRKFPGFTHVDDLARELVGLFGADLAELNGARRSLAS